MQHSTRSRRFSVFTSIACFLAALSLTAASNAQPEAAYWQCGHGRVTIISNSSAARCERLLRATLRYEQVLTELVGWEPDTSIAPLTLYSLTRDDAKRVLFTERQREEQKRTRIHTDAKYLPDHDLNIAAIVDIGGDQPLQAALFMYGQGLLTSGPTTRLYPAWFQLGVANLLNALVLRPDGSVLLNRKATFAAVVEGGDRARERLDLAALLSAQPHKISPADFNELAYRAHVWAQFGLLTTEQRRLQYRELALLMRQGTPAEEAIPAAFGITLEEMARQFGTGDWRKDASYRLPPPAVVLKIPAPIPLDAAQADAQLEVIAKRIVEYPNLD